MQKKQTIEEKIIEAIKHYQLRKKGDIICPMPDGAKAHLIAELVDIINDL